MLVPRHRCWQPCHFHGRAPFWGRVAAICVAMMIHILYLRQTSDQRRVKNEVVIRRISDELLLLDVCQVPGLFWLRQQSRIYRVCQTSLSGLPVSREKAHK